MTGTVKGPGCLVASGNPGCNRKATAIKEKSALFNVEKALSETQAEADLGLRVIPHSGVGPDGVGWLQC
jgi:hypothetical protein